MTTTDETGFVKLSAKINLTTALLHPILATRAPLDRHPRHGGQDS